MQDSIVLSKNLINFNLLLPFVRLRRACLLDTGALRSPDVSYIWNCLMAAYTKNSVFLEALGLFEELLADPRLKSNVCTYLDALKSCSKMANINSRSGLGVLCEMWFSAVMRS
ncbi:hypothetical protein CDL15_Pgr025336 [Punica granatum]|uniref:Pentatricopeptide repeat-containing protein n=1 Tax=Punica granatum TaxID=22663 RepID=A0A218W9I5_PUNGR|nr:hypothetical protein CDL15_Pgr025336 [Punica granatum]